MDGYEVLSLPGTLTQDNLCRSPAGSAMHEVCHRHPKIKYGSARLEVASRERAAYYGPANPDDGFVQLPLENGYDGGNERRLFALAFCKNSELREAFNSQILYMVETGVTKR